MKKLALWGLLISAGIALLLSPLASSWPDGLEHVAEKLGFAEHARTVGSAPIPDYSFPGVRNPSLATALAGVLGVGIVFGISSLISRLITRKDLEDESRLPR